LQLQIDGRSYAQAATLDDPLAVVLHQLLVDVAEKVRLVDRLVERARVQAERLSASVAPG
jgi:hypothetical protein